MNQTWKRTVALLLSMMMTLSVVVSTLSVQAAEDEFVVENGVLVDYKGPGGDVVIPEGVTQIKRWDPNWHAPVTSLTLPDSLVSIGDSAFRDCDQLTSVYFGSGLQSIGSSAFRRTGIVDLELPDSLTELGTYAFDSCPELRSVNTGNGLTEIIRNAFSNCPKLENLTIGSGIKIIYYFAFENCPSLTGVVIPPSVNNAYDNAFDKGAVTDLYPDFTIQNYVLTKYTGTEDTVAIPNVVQTIGDRAFAGSKVTSVTIPNSVTKIDSGAFKNCRELTEVTFGSSVEEIGEEAFSGCRKLARVSLPDSLRTIGRNGFSYCSALQELDLGDGLQELGSNSFAKCSSLKTLVIPGSVKTVEYWAFKDCTTLQDLTVQSGVETIGNSAFSGCESLKNVSLGTGLVHVDDYAFYYCRALESIVLPHGVKTMGDHVFMSCESLRTVSIPDSVTSMGKDVFLQCPKLQGVETGGDVGTRDSDFEIEGTVLVKYTGVGGVVTVPNGVTEIGKEAFYECLGLKKVVLPESITAIGDAAFRQCKNLEEINFPSQLKTIGEAAFSETLLKRVTLPDTVTYIGDHAFSFTNLTECVIPDSVENAGGWPFGGCDLLEKVVQPKGSTLFKTSSFKKAADIVKSCKALDEIVNCFSPTLSAHVSTFYAAIDGWKTPASTVASQNAKVQALSDKITDGKTSVYEKTKAIAQWVSTNIEYDYDYFSAGLKDYSQVPFAPEEVIDSGIAVCAGYAQLTQALLQAQGIPALYVTGPANGSRGWEQHAWNVAYVDGDYVWMDNTWGMKYFDLGMLPFCTDHIVSGACYYPQSSIRTEVDISVDAATMQVIAKQTGANVPVLVPDENIPVRPQEAEPEDVMDVSKVEGASPWAVKEVAEAISAGLVPQDLRSGYTEKITRQDFCRLMVALLEQTSGQTVDQYLAGKGLSTTHSFSDCSNDQVKAAYALGIVNGRSGSIFDPNGSITRQEAAAMLSRTAKVLGRTAGTRESFADTASCPGWAKESISFVSGLMDPVSNVKVMQGTGNNGFSPLGTYTREQAILTAVRMFHCK